MDSWILTLLIFIPVLGAILMLSVASTYGKEQPNIYKYIDKLIIKFWGCEENYKGQHENTYEARTEALLIVKELMVNNKTLCLIHPDLIKNLILALNPEPHKIKDRPFKVEITLGEKCEISNATIILGNKKIKTPSIKERVDTVKQHLEFSIKWKGETLGLLEMRRHYTNYFRGIQNFKEHRIKLIQSLNYYKSLEILDDISESFTNKNIVNCEQIS